MVMRVVVVVGRLIRRSPQLGAEDLQHQGAFDACTPAFMDQRCHDACDRDVQ